MVSAFTAGVVKWSRMGTVGSAGLNDARDDVCGHVARRRHARRVVTASVAEAHQRLRDLAPEVVVLTALHNNAPTIRRTVESVLSQRGGDRRWLMVIVDDGSSDGGLEVALECARGAPVLALRTSRRGVVATRNRLLGLVRGNASRRPIAIRLDADDVFGDDTTLCRLERTFRRSQFSLRGGLRRAPDAILASNLQLRDGREVGRNVADGALLEPGRLLARLDGMARGDFTAELPSCNLVLGPAVDLRYPAVTSAEDHWLAVATLLSQRRYRVALAGDILHTVYTLGGRATAANHQSQAYGSSRRHLLAWAWRTARERA